MMKSKIYTLLAASTLSLGAAAQSAQVGSGETDGYKLVWQDLFDGGELSSDRWYIEANGNGGGNNELQYYARRDENVHVGDDGRGNGCLILTAKREDYRSKSFTSGRVNSKGKVSFKHGKIEASIRLPKTADGLWPAFWMMGNDYDQVGWPKCGETDILEMGNITGINNGTQDRYFNGACHWGPDWQNHYQYAQSSTKAYSLQDDEYHLFTLIWDEDKVAMYVDLDQHPKQTPYYRMNITANDESNTASAGNYFHKENFIIFNLAVGGDFTGIHSASDITALNDENGQQANMYINYVKVYQKGDDSESLTTLIPGDAQPSDDDPIVTPEPSNDPYAPETVIAAGSVKEVQYLILDQASISKFEAAGASVVNFGPDSSDGSLGHNLWNWSNTFNSLASDGEGIGGHVDGYVCFEVGSQGWSGAGYDIRSTNPDNGATFAGVDTRSWDNETRFHLAYKTPGVAPESIALTIADGSSVGSTAARVALGSDFNDNGTIYTSIAPAATTEWQGIDVTFAQLKNASADFAPAAVENWYGNIFAFLAGGTQGRSLAFDAAYFYNYGETGVVSVVENTVDWVITANTINVVGAQGIQLYNVSGNKVAATVGSTLGIDNLAAGLYIARCGNSTRKIVIK